MKSRYIDSTGNEINRSIYESFLAKDILDHHEHWVDIYDKLNKKLVELIEYNENNYSFNEEFDGVLRLLNCVYPGTSKDQLVKYFKTPIAERKEDLYPDRMAFVIYKYIFERALLDAWILPGSDLLEDKENKDHQTYSSEISSKQSLVRPRNLFSYEGRGRIEDGGSMETYHAGILSRGATPKEMKDKFKFPVSAGRFYVRRMPQSPTIKFMEEHDLPFGAGPSGTLGFAISGMRALFGKDLTDVELRKFYMALTAFLVYEGHHTFADVGILIDALQGKESSAYKVDPKLRAKEYYDQYLTEEYRLSDSYHKFYSTHSVAKYSAITWEILRDALEELERTTRYSYGSSPDQFQQDLSQFLDANQDKYEELSPSELDNFKNLLKKHVTKPEEKKEAKSRHESELDESKPTVLSKLVKKLEDSGITLLPKNGIDWTTVHQLLSGVSYDEEKNPALSELIHFDKANYYKKSELSDKYLAELFRILLKVNKQKSSPVENQVLDHFQKKLGESGIQLTNIEAKDIAGYTPVMNAVMQNGKEMIKVLLDSKANPTTSTEEGYNLLHLANLKGSSVALLKLLLTYPDINLNAKSSHGDTPLLLAIINKRSALIPSLLQAHADVNIANSLGETPLYIAAKNGDESLVSKLIELKADVNAKLTNGTDALGIAVINGHKKVIDNLLKQGGNIDQVNKAGFTPLWEAVERRDTKLAKILLECKANPNFVYKDESLFKASLRTCAREISETLAKVIDITKVDEEGNTPLHLAVIHRLNVIDKLLEDKADVNAQNNKGKTILHMAVEANDPTLIAQALKNGANINSENSQGETPLMLAIKIAISYWGGAYERDKKSSLIKSLLEAKAEVNIADKKGLTPLTHAITQSDENSVGSLIIAKSNINLTDSEGSTPLHLAAEKGLFSIVKLLVENKADINAKRKDGKTPLEFTSHSETISYLKEISSKQQLLEDKQSAAQLTQSGIFADVKEADAGKTPGEVPDSSKKLSGGTAI